MRDQPDERTLSDYLLGSLSEVETERLDELSICDDDFAERLRDAENNLVDSYARGELAGEGLQRFNTHYLASSRRREKAAFAQALISLSGAVPQRRAEDEAISSKATLAFQPARRRSLEATSRLSSRLSGAAAAFAAAAMLLLGVGVLLERQNVKLRGQIEAEQAEHRELVEREKTLAKQLEQQQSENAEAKKEFEQVQARLRQLEQEAAGRRSGKTNLQQDLQTVVAFTLAPPLRGSNPPPAVSLKPNTGILSLTLQLETSDFSEYEVALKDPAAGRIVWRSTRLKPMAKDGARTVAIRLPAAGLKAQHYNIQLAGVSAGGAAEVISNYPFTVVREH
ncbi:MAG TPA: hypothetical protein VEZ90_09710 [Blastocatellia bacterium]|nr:hypothetical protein [Blastocatellia bacterium]